jgi:hypothetical protein
LELRKTGRNITTGTVEGEKKVGEKEGRTVVAMDLEKWVEE